MTNEKPFNKREFYGPKDAGIAFCFASIFPSLLAIILMLIVKAITKSTDNLAMTILGFLCSPIVLCLFFFVYNKTQHISIIPATKVNFKMKWWGYVLPVVLAVVMIFCFNNIVTVFDELLKMAGVSVSGINLPLDNFGWFSLAVPLIAILPAIFEELIFRGMVLNGINSIGKTGSVFLSAFLFALFHGNPSQTIYQFFLGVLFAYLVILTSSIISSMICHFVNNFTVLLIAYITRAQEVEEIVLDAKFVGLAVLYAAIGIAVIFGVYYLIKFLQQKKQKNQAIVHDLPQFVNYEQRRDCVRRVFTDKFLWIGVIFSLTIWLTNFIY